MLAVNAYQEAAKVAQLPRGGGPAVQAGSALSPDLPGEDQALARLVAHRLQRLRQGRDRADVEQRLGAGPIGSLADLIGAGARAQAEAEGVDDQGLAAAGLPCQQVEAGAEAHAGGVDECEVPDVQLL